MKNKNLVYVLLALVTFSLQSCVSNYVVTATPSNANTEYKSNTKVPKISKASLTSAKKSLYQNEAEANYVAAKTTLARVSNLETKAEIEKAIKHSQTIDEILNQASTYLGTPYRYGGTTRSGIDCSAFVLSVFNEVTGISLPRVAAAQAQEGEMVLKQELQKGDLVFFSHGRRISHVGIVQEITEDGDIKFIHAATSKGVIVSSLNDKYWGPRYRFAKRVIQ
ncbi:C40 family peptidase [Riemerella anatipestifer]|uniref:Cell wall-associated hydrolases (Invasion-associated proteins) n=2 Tax=Riemerella anatipestifer TaxID=34085 RepID=J9R476_RIEAN|nr:C40 family peptidase [Riemerella anatipestifer]ADQ82432.1 NLP/P60 protein [Riemerella anatipestifer ATCC 11845 = DSM 15868]ADZ12074.1 Cell wall-associated hydrolases (invasion-associated proteins) [Riemerella anatipestifer RA-GD]AFD56437.1 nlp/p60 protein [Riemerella anatipestifer ATCC 11845 = DSM 15868]AFR35218.1 Cell wall-associated hydrolases (invasion-associated proteins) [Riemerella anatipestifer RA-CH-1]AGC39633.1 Cell wall-associated hydrolases (invasion-associated proteins) [Riemere